jgi:ribosomal-protein-alanine acetyltransferase
MTDLPIRRARRDDLDRLCELEKRCFSGDRLSRRSLAHMLRSEHADLLIADADEAPAGYVLNLYRSGTNLARLYSIAVAPAWRGCGLSAALLQAAEQHARERGCGFMRLEVRSDNHPAIALYERCGYHRFGRIADYYEDGCDALRMEKTIRRTAQGPSPRTRYYEQTTAFTCGPACLLMAMARLQPERAMTRREELRIWREATTIFMTSGHGGCSPHGLALSAWHRGFAAALYVTPAGTPFIDSVRDPAKKEVIELVHQDYLAQLADTDVQLHERELSVAELLNAIGTGAVAITLISTWRLNRNRAPHWVVISGADDRYVYISDPDFERDPWHSETDYIDVPVAHEEYQAMARFGRSRLRATLILKAGRVEARTKKPA